MEDEKIIKQVIEENKDGLKRLADEEPAAERRSRWKRLKKRVVDLFEREDKVGHISA